MKEIATRRGTIWWPLCLGLITGLAALASYLATFDRSRSFDPTPAVLPLVFTWIGFLPPRAISSQFSNVVAKQLFFPLWHFAAFLPAAVLCSKFEGDERKCYLQALLACYFVALLLESGRRILHVLHAKSPSMR